MYTEGWTITDISIETTVSHSTIHELLEPVIEEMAQVDENEKKGKGNGSESKAVIHSINTPGKSKSNNKPRSQSS